MPINFSNFKSKFNFGKGVAGAGSRAAGAALAEDAARVPLGSEITRVERMTPEEMVASRKRDIAEQGTTSMMDLPLNLVRKIPAVKKRLPDEKYTELLYRYQQPAVDLDKRVGSWVANKAPMLKGLVTTTDMEKQFKGFTNDGKVVELSTPVESQRITAPIDKAKHFATPMLGIFGVQQIVDQFHPSQHQAQEVGDSVVPGVRTAEHRDELITKIAGQMAQQSLLKEAAVRRKTEVEKMTKAADMLKKASATIKELKTELNKVADDNKTLTLQVIAKERSRRAVKLATEMVHKKLLKTAEFDTEVDRIMDMDDKAYGLLYNTVRNVPIQKEAGELDSVSFLLSDGGSESSEKLSLRDAILSSKF